MEISVFSTYGLKASGRSILMVSCAPPAFFFGLFLQVNALGTVVNSAADSDPGSGAFFTLDPGSGKSFLRIPDPNPFFDIL